MQQTSNYALNKPEQTDTVNIENLNSNFDTLDTELKKVSDKANLIQTAGGTGTAITLANVALTNGFTVTFVVAANNSGAATTINTKPFYKPGGTSAPNLIVGKAVTVWFSTSGGCFFIKASAEGDAVAADVLAGKKFSNDNDTGIIGTMANNGAVTLTPGTADQTIAVGYHNGNGKVLGDTKLVTGNIKAGASIFGVAGKASVVDTADATAVAGEILIGDSAYVNGSKINGSMPNNGAVNQSLAINGTYTIPTGYHNGSGKVTQALTTKTAATITPGTTDQTIAAGQYLSGAQTIKGDANLVSANIAKGKTIFNVAGIFEDRLINFPLSFQDAAPTPIRAGHIWVKSSTLASQITTVKILEALNAGEADGTLMLVVGDLALHGMSFSNTLDPTDGSSAKAVSIANTTDSSMAWDIASKSGDVTSSFKINKPLVYSKVGGVLDIETAYIWNGSSWVMLSQKGSYLVGDYGTGTGTALRPYSVTGDILTVGTSFGNTGYSYMSHFSNDGTYFFTGRAVYKRVGDVFSLYFTLPTTYVATNTYSLMGQPDGLAMTGNGDRILAIYSYYSSPTYSYYLIYYKNDGTTFVQNQVLGLGGQYGYGALKASRDGSRFVFSYATGSTYPYTTTLGAYFCENDVYVFKNTLSYPATPTGLRFAEFDLTNNKLYLVMPYGSSQGMYSLSYPLNADGTVGSYTSLGTLDYSQVFNTDLIRRLTGNIFIGSRQALDNTGAMQVLSGADLSTGVRYTITIPFTVYTGWSVTGLGVNFAEDRIAILMKNSTANPYRIYICSYVLDTTAKTILLTQVGSTINFSSTAGGVGYCPNKQ